MIALAMRALEFLALLALLAGVAWNTLARATAEAESPGIGVSWDMGALSPGEGALARDALQLSVISTDTWSLRVTGSLDSGPVESGTIRTEVELTLREAGGSGGDVPLAQGSITSGLTLDQQPATPPGGRAIALDVAVRPSWSDPPGIGFAASLSLSVDSEGESSVLAAVVEPNPLVEGYGGPLRFWYWVEEPGSEGTPIELAVEFDGRRLGEAEGAARDPGWNAVDWTPPSPLTPGLYSFEIVSESGTTLARGDFSVYSLVALESEVSPLAFGGAPQAAARSAQVPSPGLDLLPRVGLEVRLVSGDRARSTWEATLVNASSIYALEVQVEICPPAGWSWLGADAPWKSPAGDATSGGAGSGAAAEAVAGLPVDAYRVAVCHTVLLGSIKGQSERKFRFSLQPVVSLGFTGLARAAAIPSSWITFYVRSAPALGEPGVIVHRAQVPVDPSAFLEATTIRGRTFVDVNGSGAWEEGEPLIGGVDIVVDGMRAGRSTATGAFTVEVHRRPLVIWARTSRGMGVPVSLGSHSDLRSLWIVDLPVPPAAVPTPAETARPAPLAQVLASPSLQSPAVSPPAPVAGRDRIGHTELFLHAGASYGAGGPLGGAGARLFTRSERWEIDASAAGARREVFSQEGPMPETSATVETSATFRGDAATVQAAWRRGLMEEVRWGALRPSKPVLEAWRVAVETKPFVVKDPLGMQPVATGAAEAAGAVGDRWSCAVRRASTEWLLGNHWLVGERLWGEHRRLEKKGEAAETYGETSLGLRGLVDLAGSEWPYRLDVALGRERTLAPSCGLSPTEGIHGSLRISVPGTLSGSPADSGALVESVKASLSIWPDRKGATGSTWRESERAAEIVVESADLARRFGGEGVLKVSPFAQWGIVPEEGQRTWSVLGVRAEVGYLRHRLTFEAGPKPIHDRKPSADEPHERAGRLAASWRYRGGAVEARVAMDREGGEGGAYDFEAGITVNAAISPDRAPWIGRETRLALSVARSLSESDRADEVTITLSRGGRTEPADRLSFEWKGNRDSSGLGFFSGAGPYDTAKAALVFSRTRPGALVTRTAHDARPWFRAEGWTARVGLSQDKHTVEYSQALAAEGVWRFGTWLVELRRVQGWDGAAPFESALGRVAWNLRSAGWGLHVEIERLWNEHAGVGGAGGRDGWVVRGTRRISAALEVFAEVGRARNSPPAHLAGTLAGPGGGVPPGNEAVVAGFSVDLSKLGSGRGLFAGLPLVLTAGVEGGVATKLHGEPGQPGLRLFAGLGLPLEISHL